MRIMVLGIRGIPDVQGGVETHALHLYTQLVELGCDVEAIVRSPFVPAETRMCGAIRLRRIWSPRVVGLEALVHSVLGVLYAAVVRPDILHIHAIGPAIVTPLARVAGLRVVVTHHGADYDRDKWGAFARWTLRTGESLGMRYSNARIVISKVIAGFVQRRHGRTSDLIPNGVRVPELQSDAEHVVRFGLEPGRYFLQVSRMVPEKRQLDLIAAYSASRVTAWKLALVGKLDGSAYSERVISAAQAAGVVLTDYLSGAPLQQIYTHAGAFVLPSTHEGLPIAMLEALSFGLPVIASDIAANLEVGLSAECYFPVGDVAALAAALVAAEAAVDTQALRDARRHSVRQLYNWPDIARATRDVYRRVLRLAA